jgi:predicted membrane chloride channel (bestrophin family)
LIQYDPHRWFQHFFRLRGSMFRAIIGRVLLCVASSALVVAIDLLVRLTHLTADFADASMHHRRGTALKGLELVLVDSLGGCERIRKSPLPFASGVHLRRALVVCCLALPFALGDNFGWATVVDALIVAYMLLGIEEIGVEIEGPFGNDNNDLPLEDIFASIRKTLLSMMEEEHAEREALPEGL